MRGLGPGSVPCGIGGDRAEHILTAGGVQLVHGTAPAADPHLGNASNDLALSRLSAAMRPRYDLDRNAPITPPVVTSSLVTS